MTPFQEWLGKIGLAHCAQILLENDVDFDVAPDLTQDNLRSIGLNLGDSLRLLKAITRLDPAARSHSDGAGVADVRSKPSRASQGELRQLTVMFCDLVGYAALTQRLDQEVLKLLTQAYYAACDKVVEKYQGSVRQYLGDGVMVYFGLPAHEDDAERCVRSALEIVQAVKRASVAEPLAVRIGIATGLVVVAEASGAGNAEDGLAVGETPTLAARLQEGVAGRDEVVIDPNTLRLVGTTFELDDLGEHTLKGIVKPVRAWRVQAVLGKDRFDAAHGDAALTDLVGRNADVAWLVRHWEAARSGEGQVVLLSGEAGIGKSRLTQELRKRIKGDAHTTLRYQCSPFRRHSALSPIIEQLEFDAGFAREDTAEKKLDKLEKTLVGTEARRAESATLFADLLSLPTDRYPPLGLSPQRRKEKTLDMLVGQVEVLSRRQPVLIVFEDAHWIDPTSQELLDVLVPRLRALSVLMVLTYRPEEYTPRGSQYAHLPTLGLAGLLRDEGTELVGKVVPQGKTLPPEVIDRIVAHADGVPLFIEELTKSVLESRQLHKGDDPLTALAIPETLSASLMERLGRCSADVRELALIGACIGRKFSHELLAAVSPRKGEEFEDELEQLIRTGLVFRSGTPPDATYTFKHALVQDAAYELRLKSKRPQLHAQIAQALENEFQERVDSEPELLAHHHTEAGNLNAAIPLWRKAGQSALARVALQEAVAYLQKGLAIVDRLPPSPERDDLELSLREPLHSAQLRWDGWAAPEVRANAEAILRLPRSQDRPQSQLIGLWGGWISTITQGRVAEAPDWVKRLLAEGSKNGDLDLQIIGHRGSMSTHFYLGELREAHEQAKRVLALYDSSLAERWMELTGNDVRTAVGVFSSQWLWMLGYPDQAAQVSDQKDADARRRGHPFDIGWALTWGSYVFDYRFEPEELLKRVDEADHLGRGSGQKSIPVLYKVMVPVGRGLAKLRLGLLPESISLLEEGIGAWNASGGHLNVPYLKSALAEAHALQDDLDTGLRLIGECLEQIERLGWHERVWLAETLRLKGWMLMRQGNLAEAESKLRESIDWARRQQARSWELRSSTTLAGLLAERGQRDAARELLEPIYQSFTEGFGTHDLEAARTLLESLR